MPSYTGTLNINGSASSIDVPSGIDMEGSSSLTQSGGQTLTWGGTFTANSTGIIGTAGATVASEAAGGGTMNIKSTETFKDTINLSSTTGPKDL